MSAHIMSVNLKYMIFKSKKYPKKSVPNPIFISLRFSLAAKDGRGYFKCVNDYLN